MLVEHIYGREGDRETRYMTRVRLTPRMFGGRLFLHIFHRGDADRYPHDHPWAYWTFPLANYREYVLTDDVMKVCFVKRFRLHHRPPEHTHRVLDQPEGRRLITLVWHGRQVRDWGFWVENNEQAAGFHNRLVKGEISEEYFQEVRRCSRNFRKFIPWREYVHGFDN